VRRLLRTLLLAGVLTGFAAAPAVAGTDFQIFSDYTKKGRIDPCKYTTAQLEAALKAVTPDVRQYASDYPGALKDAIAARASGTCDPTAAGGGTTAPTTPAAPPSSAPSTPSGGAPAPVGAAPAASVVGEPPTPGVATDPAAPVESSGQDLSRAASGTGDNSAPAPLVGLGILAILAALTAALFVALRRLGFGEGRLAPTYHSVREARWRAGGVWAEFRDWLRVGR
jgi:hypothetical protein